MSEREVVITGAGLVSPIGKNVEENWMNVGAMNSGIIHNPGDDRPLFMQYIGKVQNYDLPQDISPRQRGQMKFLNRGSTLGFSATCEAISGHVESLSEIPPGRRALYVASGDFTKVGSEFMYPAIKDSSDQNWETIDSKKLNSSALNKVNPFFLLESLHNNLFSFLSAFVEFMGPSTSLASLSPCGGNALELAYRSIRLNQADIALAVGYGSWISEIPLFELEGLGILSSCRSGAHSFRPFDKNRDGFIPGEGGSAIVLESLASAEKRGSTILATIKGVENFIEFSSNDKLSVPDKVTKKNIRSALINAGKEIHELGFIIPHGSGTKKGDRSELRSIKDLCGNKETIPLCALKPYTGHMGAASDLAEIIMGIKASKEKMVPATLNFEAAEKDFADMVISNSAQPCDKQQFMSISYGIGGQSSSVILETGP